ncbi:LacI family DNA-binding transcriptional regulator [Gorillibacterium sp. sgz5001074]|uniref:LacI family DNA-binding transcriptional regulator n=1 Tax=Gorillibacterium sp. sgz5001074 TaxID=3446695 RepID=UPI003F67D75F
MTNKKVSMQQIADAVGVSKYAVSKALAGKEGVSPQTREKIIEMATRFGYFKQLKAVKPRSSQPSGQPVRFTAEEDEIPAHDKQAVAVLMPNVRLQTLDSAFWSMVVQGIGMALSRRGLGMLIFTEINPEQFAKVMRPDSLLGLIGVGEVSTSMLLEVRRLGLPFVLTDHEDPLVPSDSIFAANIDSMSLMTGHLLALGHRRFWFLGDTSFSRSFTDRFTGFRLALEKHGIPVDPDHMLLPLSGSDREGNLRLLENRLDRARESGETLPGAWVCANDEIALAALELLGGRDIQVPSAVSVTGFDNIEESQRAAVPLTTVHVMKEKLGERAVAALLDRIREPDRPVEKISQSCSLVQRASSGAPAVW